MNSKTIVSFIVLFLLFIVSCNSQSSVTQSPTSTVNPNITNSPIATTTLNFMFVPSATLSSRDATQVHNMFTAIPATLQARNVKCKDGFGLEMGLDVIRMSNDEWTLLTCSPQPKDRKDKWTPGVVNFGTRYTQIIKTDLSRTWTIQHNEFDYSIIDRPDAFIAPYRWTADGKYLYFYPQYYPGGSGGPESYFLYTLINNLYRINLETGEFKLFLSKDQFGALAFSPNDQFLVYSERNTPDVIHVKNMGTDSDLQIKLNEDIVAAGAFVWSPNNSQVIFVVGYGEQRDLSGTAIFVLNPKNMSVRKVLANDIRMFEPYGCSDDHNVWLDENTICLDSANHELDTWNKFFSFNIKTGEVKYLYSWGEEFPTSTP